MFLEVLAENRRRSIHFGLLDHSNCLAVRGKSERRTDQVAMPLNPRMDPKFDRTVRGSRSDSSIGPPNCRTDGCDMTADFIHHLAGYHIPDTDNAVLP